jgi:hypothetical protein
LLIMLGVIMLGVIMLGVIMLSMNFVECCNGTVLTLIVEGTTENVLQFIMSQKSIYDKNFCFNAQK